MKYANITKINSGIQTSHKIFSQINYQWNTLLPVFLFVKQTSLHVIVASSLVQAKTILVATILSFHLLLVGWSPVYRVLHVCTINDV